MSRGGSKSSRRCHTCVETWLLEACGDNMLIHPQLSRGAHARKEAHPVQDESCGKSTRTTNDHLLVLFVIFYFQFLFFVCIFYFSCVLNWFISFLCRNVWIFPPLKLMAEFTLGGHRLVFCKLEKFSVPLLYFVSYYLFILFLFAYYCFLTLGTMSSLSVGVSSLKNDQIENFCTFDFELVSFVSMLLLFVFLISFVLFNFCRKFLKNPKILSCFPYCFKLDFY